MMTATATKKPFKATFILDTRGREESVDQMIEDIKKELASLSIDVTKVENLGRRDFVRKPDPSITAGNYVQFDLDGGKQTVAQINEHFRLNKTVYRTLVQLV